MKNIILYSILIFVVSLQVLSCQTIKSTTNEPITEKDNFIPYMLPIKTEQVIYDNLKPLLSEPISLGIRFEFISTGLINVYINVFKKGYDKEHILTNRKIFINDTFYPLVLEMDNTFNAKTKGGFPLWNVSRTDPENERNDISTDEKIPPLNERESLRGVYLRKYIIKHNTPIIQINLEGNIVNN